MTEADFVEICEQRAQIYEGKILNLRCDTVTTPGGCRVTREVVEHDPAVVILAENEQGELLLIRQFRYPVMKTIVELPAGIVERGEAYEEAAVRELQEETGWKPSKLEKIAEVFSSPGFCTELFVMYYATDLTSGKLPGDEDECIEPRFAKREEVERMLANGEIVDAKTLLGIYWWMRRKDRKS